jgi:hypothetical protein
MPDDRFILRPLIQVPLQSQAYLPLAILRLSSVLWPAACLIALESDRAPHYNPLFRLPQFYIPSQYSICNAVITGKLESSTSGVLSYTTCRSLECLACLGPKNTVVAPHWHSQKRCFWSGVFADSSKCKWLVYLGKASPGLFALSLYLEICFNGAL